MSKYTCCAWDVGIKTLSYCVIEFDKDNDVYWKVLYLGQINLLSDNIHTCCAKISKTKTACATKAMYYGKNINDQEYYYCGKHKNQYDTLFKHDEYFKIEKNTKDKFLCNHILTNNSICNKKAIYTMNDYATRQPSIAQLPEEKFEDCAGHAIIRLCTAHMNTTKKKIENQVKLAKIKKITCGSENLEQLGTTMYTKFNEISYIFDVNKVRIENQPSLINPIMKSLSMLIFSYAINKKMSNNTISSIKFIAPSTKLNISFDNMFNIITSSESDKIKILLNKLLLETCSNLKISDYKNHFVESYDFFLAIVAMKAVNKKYDINENNKEINELFKSNNNEIITKNNIIILLNNIHKVKSKQKKSKKTINKLSNTAKTIDTEMNIGTEITDNSELANTETLDTEQNNKKMENKLIYNITKTLSIEYALIELKKNNQKNFCDYIKKHNKCDDLTDSILLCLKSR